MAALMTDPGTGAGLDHYPHIHTRDIEPARAAFGRLYGEVSLFDARGDAGTFEWRAQRMDLGPIAVVSSFSRGDLLLRATPSSYVITLTGGSGARGTSPHGTVEIAGGRGAAVYSPGVAGEWCAYGERAGATVIIDPHFLHAELLALTGVATTGPRGSMDFALAMPLDAGPGVGVERLCRFLVDEIRHGGAPLSHALITDSLCQGIARALLLGQPHAYTHLLHKPAPRVSPGALRLVEEYVDAHAGGPIRARDLAALTGASGLAIEASFRARRGASLAFFTRRRRLQQARQKLLMPEPGMTVTGIGAAAGFLDRRRFNVAYAALFGEHPEETWRRGRVVREGPPTPRLSARILTLTPRERSVCELVSRGMLNKQIAAELGISEGTVKVHRARGLEKLGVTSAAEVARLFARMKRGG